jgi:proteasome lid subunit RPN8/RPN11
VTLVKRCRLAGRIADAIVEHARRSWPRECCGLLLGQGEEVLEAVPAPNLAPDPNRFVLDPTTHIRVRREARNRGLDVVGYYHSHPNSPAEPSARDVAEAADDDAVYLIVSLEMDTPSVRAFTIREGGFAEVSIVDAP